MELIPYARALIRWLWLIGVVAVIFGAGGFLYTKIQRLQYAATATVQVGDAKYSQNPGTDELQARQNIANDDAIIAKTDPVLKAALTKLQLDMQPADLSRTFQVNILPGTTLIEIAVTYSDAATAANIANAVADALVASTPTTMVKEQQDEITLLTAEIDATRTQLSTTRQGLKDTDAAIASAGSTASPDLATRHNFLTDQIHQQQDNLVQLIATLVSVQRQSSSNTLVVVQAARVPTQPIGPPAIGIVILAAVLGAVLAATGIVIREFVRDAIHNPSELSTRFGLNIVGTIPPFGRVNKAVGKLIMWRNPHSPIAEAYRALRVNLTYTDNQVSRHPQVYVVTSPNPGDGKSITAANLAVAFAITGAHVLLVDADLRRPTQHTIFNLSNLKGLLDFMGKTTAAGEQKIPENTASIVNKTEVPGLSVLTAGSLPATPTEFLGTIRMQDELSLLATDSNYDVVIFDTPPLLSVSDSTLVASVTRGNVILVIDPNRTQRGAVIRVAQQLSTLAIPLVGLVLNRFNARRLDANFGIYLTGRYEAVPAITGRSENSDLAPTQMTIQDKSQN